MGLCYERYARDSRVADFQQPDSQESGYISKEEPAILRRLELLGFIARHPLPPGQSTSRRARSPSSESDFFVGLVDSRPDGVPDVQVLAP